MRKEDKREHPLLHSVRVVHPLGQHALLHLLDQLCLLHVVRDRVGGHVKQQEVLLLCRQHSLLDLNFEMNTELIFRIVIPGSLQASPSHSSAGTSASAGSKSHPTDIQSMSERKQVSIKGKGNCCCQNLDCLLLVRLLDMLERLVKENIPTGVRVFQHDLPTKKVFPSHASPVTVSGSDRKPLLSHF